MWSGPRNISTAMMRAWGNRPDTIVVDEPLYAAYLARTKADHPGRDEVIAAGETDWRKVLMRLTSEPLPAGKRVFYQKHMTHHLLPEMSRDWLRNVTNCFLIRDPREVIVSYLRKNGDPSADDVGFPQQAELFDIIRAETAGVPPVIDARDVLENPRRTLAALCDAVGVEFSDAMLSWPPGLRETDGVWAKHWYAEVLRSTGFQSPKETPSEVPARLADVYARCVRMYERLREHRL